MGRVSFRAVAGLSLAAVLAGGCGPEPINVGFDQRVSPPRPAPPATAGSEAPLYVGPVNLRRVVLDAGHGGHDTGALSSNAIAEKDVTLSVALRLKTLLEARGVEVVLTRRDDRFVELSERSRIANGSKADLLLSIHCNAAPSSEASGLETFALAHPLGTGRARKPGLKQVNQQTQVLARCIQAEMTRVLGGPDRGVKAKNLCVLRETLIPAALAEVGFITNADTEHNLHLPAYRQRIAEALCLGLARYGRETVPKR